MRLYAMSFLAAGTNFAGIGSRRRQRMLIGFEPSCDT